MNVSVGRVLIPANIEALGDPNVKEELIQIFLDSLEDKTVDDIRMLLNVSNEIFSTYKKE